MGLIQGLEFSVPAGPIVSKALLEQKLVLISAGTNIIRFVPPLVIEKADVDEMMKRLRQRQQSRESVTAQGISSRAENKQQSNGNGPGN